MEQFLKNHSKWESCTHDDCGKLIQASSKTILMCYSLAEVEAMTLREAIKQIIQLRLCHVVFETDCKAIIDAFHRIDQSEFRCLVKDCEAFFPLGTNLTLRFIKRQANRVAHIVVRVACYNANPS